MPGGSGYANYQDATNNKYGEPHLVPLKMATEESIKDYGRIVRSFEDEAVWISPWPVNGWRPLYPGTGQDGGITSGEFRCSWKDDLCTAQNEAVGGDYVTGRLPNDVSCKNRTYVLTREANYHPDGGQVFFPANNNAFVLVLALPGDDVKLDDFVAFYFDGTFGVQIKADIWHQPIYPVDDEAVFIGKQGKVHACVVVDTVEEFGRFLKVPLNPELAS